MSLNIDITVNYLKIDKRKFNTKDLLKLPLLPFDPNNITTAIARFSFLEFIDLLNKQDKRCKGLKNKILLPEHHCEYNHYNDDKLSNYARDNSGFGIIGEKESILYVSYLVTQEFHGNNQAVIYSLVSKKSIIKKELSKVNELESIDYDVLLNSRQTDLVCKLFWYSDHRERLVDMLSEITDGYFDYYRTEELIETADESLRTEWIDYREVAEKNENEIENSEFVSMFYSVIKYFEKEELESDIAEISKNLESPILDLPFVLI